MEAKKETSPPFFEQLKEYAETRIKLAKYQAIEGGTTFTANLIVDLVIIFSTVLAFLFASFTIALLLGQLFGHYWEGFGCVTILYIIFVLILKYNRQSMEKPIINALIQKILKNK
jgi:hypothetical protein